MLRCSVDRCCRPVVVAYLASMPSVHRIGCTIWQSRSPENEFQKQKRSCINSLLSIVVQERFCRRCVFLVQQALPQLRAQQPDAPPRTVFASCICHDTCCEGLAHLCEGESAATGPKSGCESLAWLARPRAAGGSQEGPARPSRSSTSSFHRNSFHMHPRRADT